MLLVFDLESRFNYSTSVSDRKSFHCNLRTEARMIAPDAQPGADGVARYYDSAVRRTWWICARRLCWKTLTSARYLSTELAATRRASETATRPEICP